MRIISLLSFVVTLSIAFTSYADINIIGTWQIQSDQEFTIYANFSLDGKVTTKVVEEGGRVSEVETYRYRLVHQYIEIYGYKKGQKNHFLAKKFKIKKYNSDRIFLTYNLTGTAWYRDKGK